MDFLVVYRGNNSGGKPRSQPLTDKRYAAIFTETQGGVLTSLSERHAAAEIQ